MQRGFALLIILLVLGSGALYALLRTLNQNNLQIERDKMTEHVLAQAKEALTGYAIKMPLKLSGSDGRLRPGDLPCPDLKNDGMGGASCGTSNGLRLGRLPWKELGLPDLRDGYGERLWYAVSNNFKDSTRLTPLNSNTNGTITVRDNKGSSIHNGASATGAIAIIFSPGPPLVREGATSTQDRTCTGIGDCASAVCTTTPASLTPSCNPINYLDAALGEDNADFTDSSNVNGFIHGKVTHTSGNILINDQLRVLSYEDLMPIIEQRVASEVAKCLTEYANANLGRYPWATPLNPSAPPAYTDSASTYFGHLPEPLLTQTNISSSAKMRDHWVGLCGIGVDSAAWWTANQWKEQVFYAVAPDYAPATTSATTCSSGCLTVNGAAISQSGKQFVVMVAGRPLVGQSRTTNAQKGNATNYLESSNSSPWPNSQFQRGLVSVNFNDQVLFFPR